jgi:succinate-acetate transporter protein
MSVNYEIFQLQKPTSPTLLQSPGPSSIATESPTNTPLEISPTDNQNQHHINRQNPLMFGILGFFAAVFPFSLLQIAAPKSSPIFIQWSVFGGLIQVYAATKEFELGHSLSGCIFLVFGSNWVSQGLTYILRHTLLNSQIQIP